MEIPQFDYQKGEFVENIEPKSDVYKKRGRIIEVIKSKGKIKEVRVKYKEDLPTIVRVYMAGFNLHYISPSN